MTDSTTDALLQQEEQARDGDAEAQTEYASVSYSELTKSFVLMGWTAFGGPSAHIALFETVRLIMLQTFIQKRRWMSETVFLELFALASCLPGPTSTQVSFALGAVKRGIPGGLLGGVLFQYPGLLMMAAAGVGAAKYLDTEQWQARAVVDGLAAVAVALVAVAAKGLVLKTAKDRVTSMTLLSSAAVSFMFAAPWLFPALILGGGAVTLIQNTLAKQDMAMPEAQAQDGVKSFGLSRASGFLLLLFWAVLLATALALRALTDYSDHYAQPLHWFETFYRVGSLIYGGGQVVLPLLLTEVVQQSCWVDDHGARHCAERPDSWVTSDQFKAGLALIQAMPGPMFNLSAYLGAVIAVRAGWNFAVGVAACWLGLFGPGILLLYGLLPFWGGFRRASAYRRALPGLAAAAVGLVVMALFAMYDSFTRSSMFPKTSVAIGLAGFFLVDSAKQEPPYVVLLGGILGFAAAVLHLP